MKRKYIWYALFLVLLVLSGAYSYSKFYKITHPKQVFEQSPKSSSKINKSVSEKSVENKQSFDSSKVYIAFLGLDKTEDRIKTIGNFRTDTIGIFAIDLDTKSVKLLSIPRDTYVSIPGRPGKDKINAAYVYGGMGKSGFEKSLQTISDFLGIDVNYYVSIDMEVIPNIVDAVGGVQINVEEDMHTHGANLNKGLQWLDGQKASEYVRWRYDPMGDINRVKRQQKFIIAFLQQLHRNNNISTYINLYNAFKNQIHTNLNLDQVLALAYLMKDVDLNSIKMYQVPGDFYNLHGISYWKPDMQKLSDILRQYTS